MVGNIDRGWLKAILDVIKIYGLEKDYDSNWVTEKIKEHALFDCSRAKTPERSVNMYFNQNKSIFYKVAGNTFRLKREFVESHLDYFNDSRFFKGKSDIDVINFEDPILIEKAKTHGKSIQGPKQTEVLSMNKSGIDTGAGFGTIEKNKDIEVAAISFVRNRYEMEGWTVQSVESEKCGFDLRCIKNNVKEDVEVKGVQSEKMSFIITAGEKKQAEMNDRFILCVVLSAILNPQLHKYSGEDFLQLFSLTPISYYANLKNS